MRKWVYFSYEHAPYEATRFKEERYRQGYCTRLAEMAKRANPDLIFLSNFKIFLHPSFVEVFKDKIVNVHPSVLPLLKGFRPEHRADQGEEPGASGYTMHLVDTDLDGGPTLFQQYVPLEPKDVEREKRLGSKEYSKKREEAHRLKIIQAQAQWSPQVLALVASDTPRKIVTGAEAFIAEGRPDFPDIETYRNYSRVLFEKGNGWRNAEMIQGAPQKSNEAGPDVITRYSFVIPGEPEVASRRFARLIQLADDIRSKRGMNGGLKTKYIKQLGSPAHSTAYIEFPYNAEEEFKTLMQEQMNDVTLEIETKPTRVLAPRKPFLTDDAH